MLSCAAVRALLSVTHVLGAAVRADEAAAGGAGVEAAGHARHLALAVPEHGAQQPRLALRLGLGVGVEAGLFRPVGHRPLAQPLGPLLPPVQGQRGNAAVALGQAVDEVPVVVSEVEKVLGAVLINRLVIIVLTQISFLQVSLMYFNLLTRGCQKKCWDGCWQYLYLNR